MSEIKKHCYKDASKIGTLPAVTGMSNFEYLQKLC